MQSLTFEKLIKDVRNFPLKPRLMRFCGIGDPLFNKKTPEFIELANISKVVERTELITNGLLLKDESIVKISKNLDRIVISVEGLSDRDYEEFTLRKVKYDNLLNNIRKLYEINDRKCIIHVKIHNQSVLTIERKEKFFNDFCRICDEIYIENLVDLWPEKKSNLGLNAGHRFEGGGVDDSIVCPQIFKSLQVNADGRVLPCCVDWKSMNIVGDISKDSLNKIWSDSPINELRMKHLQGKRFEFSPCKGCTHNEYSDKDNLDKARFEILKRIASN